MKIFPAIDIKDKKCVRLIKGNFDNKTEYEISPIEQAGKYKDKGFKNIHIVDLDGALTGNTVNLETIQEIVNKLDLGASKLKIPHMGWNELKIKNSSKVFQDINKNDHAYFIHSYEFIPEDKTVISLTSNYGKEVMAAVSLENIFGSQFHPEKSQITGIKILTNFLNL